jgi:nucleoprotein TPR
LASSQPERDVLFESTRKELNEMKESRAKTESMIQELIKQRDLYRSLLERDAIDAGENLLGSSNNAAAVATPSRTPREGSSSEFGKSPSSSHKQHSQHLASRIQGLESDLKEANDKMAALKSRVSELELSESRLTSELFSTTKALTASVFEMEGVNKTLELERQSSQQNEVKIRALNDKLRETTQSLSDAERAKSNLQAAHHHAQRELTSLQTDLKTAKEALQRTEVNLEIAKATETQLRQQMEDFQEDRRLSLSLAASMHTLEQGLERRTEQSKQLQEDLHALQKRYDDEIRNHQHADYQFQRKIAALEGELRLLANADRVRASELHALQEKLAREEANSLIHQQKSVALEKQVIAYTAVLAEYSAASEVDPLKPKNNAQALEEALNKIENLKAQLGMADTHIVQYKAIGTRAEQSLAQLQTAHAALQESSSKEIQLLQEELAQAQEDLKESQLTASKWITELQLAREAAQQADTAHMSQVEVLEDTINVLRMNGDSLDMQLKATQQLFQDANTDIDTLRQQITAEDNLRVSLETRLTAQVMRNGELHSQVDGYVARISELTETLKSQKLEFEAKINELDARHKDDNGRIQSLKSTNELLSSQVLALGAQVDRLIQTHSSSASSATSESGMLLFESEAAFAHQLSEIRQVLQLTRLERDMLESKASALESSVSHLNATLLATQQSLAETRNALCADLTAQAPVIADSEGFNMVLSNASSVRVLQDSISQLNAENKAYESQVRTLETQLSSARNEVSVLNARLKTLRADKEAADVNVAALQEDCSRWQQRLQQLIDRYGDVDPVAHKQLEQQFADYKEQAKVELDAVQSEVESLKSQLHDKGNELASLRSTYDSLDKNAGALRERFREFKKSAETEKAKLSEESASLKSAKEELEQMLDESRESADTANATIESLENKLSEAESQVTELLAARATATRTPSPTKGFIGAVADSSATGATGATDSAKTVGFDESTISPSAANNGPTAGSQAAGGKQEVSLEKSIREKLLGMKRSKSQTQGAGQSSSSLHSQALQALEDVSETEDETAPKRSRVGGSSSIGDESEVVPKPVVTRPVSTDFGVDEGANEQPQPQTQPGTAVPATASATKRKIGATAAAKAKKAVPPIAAESLLSPTPAAASIGGPAPPSSKPPPPPQPHPSSSTPNISSIPSIPTATTIGGSGLGSNAFAALGAGVSLSSPSASTTATGGKSSLSGFAGLSSVAASSSPTPGSGVSGGIFGSGFKSSTTSSTGTGAGTVGTSFGLPAATKGPFSITASSTAPSPLFGARPPPSSDNSSKTDDSSGGNN